MSVLTVELSRSGDAVPDAYVKDLVDDSILSFHQRGVDTTHHIGSDILLNAYRLAIIERKIAPEDIVFKYESVVYAFDDKGNIVGGWPKGYQSLHMDMILSILGSRNKRRN